MSDKIYNTAFTTLAYFDRKDEIGTRFDSSSFRKKEYSQARFAYNATSMYIRAGAQISDPETQIFAGSNI